MKFKSMILVLTLVLGITACSSVQKIVYRINVPQGNYLEASKVNQVKVGMNVEQVQYLLGTPVLMEPFNQYVWHYVFLQQKAYHKPEQHTFTVQFDDKGLVQSIHLDKPLPKAQKEEINNVIIEKSAQSPRRWWQF